jgi:hypothetical protein
MFGTYYAFVQAELFRLARYEYWADRFYSAAKRLVANPETPSDIVSLVEDLSELLTTKRAPMGVYQIFKKKIGAQRKRGEGDKSEGKYREFFQKHPDLASCTGVVMHAGLLAASYVTWVGGPQARAVLADVFAEMELRGHEIADAKDVRAASSHQRPSGLVPLIMRR